MCGRTACACEPGVVSRACTYRSQRAGGKPRQPRWVNGKRKGDVGRAAGRARYYPSFNVAPSTNMPVLLSADHPHCQPPAAAGEAQAASAATGQRQAESESSGGDGQGVAGERVLQTMRWGLVPHWQKEGPKAGPMLNNCRFEGIDGKPSFRNALKRGQRCVVLCDGFFEWKTTGKDKQPYFMTFSSDSNSALTDKDLDVAQAEADRLDEAEGTEPTQDAPDPSRATKFGNRQPKRLLTMAGLFDIWHPPAGSELEGDGPLFSYSIVTVEASSSISWLHHRMPAMLDGDDAIRQWLDFGSVPTEKALSLIRSTSCLQWHPVTQAMNSIKYKEPDAIVKVDPRAAKPKPKPTGLTAWLKVSPSKRRADDEVKVEGEPEAKKPAEDTAAATATAGE